MSTLYTDLPWMMGRYCICPPLAAWRVSPLLIADFIYCGLWFDLWERLWRPKHALSCHENRDPELRANICCHHIRNYCLGAALQDAHVQALIGALARSLSLGFTIGTIGDAIFNWRRDRLE